MPPATLLKDLLTIPETVHRGDFVLKLTEGVRYPKETLEQYVVTDQLVGCFQQALELVRAGITSNSSKASYLHGSFGSGKSHFMAVLHLLLQHDEHVRNKAELVPLLEEHGSWLESRKFLLVPFHMLGSHSMESAILGGYASYVRQQHPDARPRSPPTSTPPAGDPGPGPCPWRAAPARRSAPPSGP